MGAGAIAAGIGAVGAIGGSLISSSAAGRAADTQSAAADRAAALTHEQYLQTRGDLAPFRDTGATAFNRLAQLYGLGGGAPPASTPAASNPLAAGAGGSPLVPGASTAGGLPPGYFLVPKAGEGFNSENGGGWQSAPTQLLVDPSGNVVQEFPAGFSPSLVATISGLTQPTAAPAPAAAPPGTSADALAAYGLPGLTYNPADYGLGNGTFNPAAYGLGNGTFQPTQAQLEATPGYQFTRDQGLRSVQNSATARGQGISGAALKGAARYATGLADNTLKTQADIYNQNLTNARGVFGGNVATTQGIFQQNLSNIINPLLSYSQLGENAAAQTGALGSSAINAQANLLTGGANAQAAGMVGSANALSSGLGSLGQAPLNYLLYSKLFGAGGGGGTLGSLNDTANSGLGAIY